MFSYQEKIVPSQQEKVVPSYWEKVMHSYRAKVMPKDTLGELRRTIRHSFLNLCWREDAVREGVWGRRALKASAGVWRTEKWREEVLCLPQTVLMVGMALDRCFHGKVSFNPAWLHFLSAAHLSKISVPLSVSQGLMWMWSRSVCSPWLYLDTIALAIHKEYTFVSFNYGPWEVQGKEVTSPESLFL